MNESSRKILHSGLVTLASALLLIIGLPGSTAHAAVTSCTGTGTTFAGGAGTTASPYQVATQSQLAAISGGYLSCAYSQTADITLVGNWNPIGAVVGLSGEPYLTNAPFTGSYDGNSKTISGLSISAPAGANSDSGIGLFGSIDGASIYNLTISGAVVSAELREGVGVLVGNAKNSTIEDVQTTGSVQGIRGVGGLVGKIAKGSVVRACTSSASVASYFDGGGGLVGGASPADSDNTLNLIANSSSSGDVTGARRGSLGTGGLVGFSFGSLTIEDSWATGDVYQPDGPRAGGLIGLIYPTGGGTNVTVLQSFAQGDVHVDGVGASGGYPAGDVEAGGLVGVLFEGTIMDSFSVGSVTGDVRVGGLVGSATTSSSKSVDRSYSLSGITTDPIMGTGGGILGFSEVSPSVTLITATFWNPTNSGVSAANDFGTEQTLAQMKLTNTYSSSGWDISETTSGSSVWVINPASGCLPYLRAIPESQVGTPDTSGASSCAEPAPAPAPEPEPSAEPTVNPTVTPVVIPTTAPVAEPVALPAGEGGALINGVATPVTVAAAPGGKAVVVSAGGVTVEVGGTSPDGTPLPLAADGSLVIAPTGGVQMGGSGFSPNSMVSLYLYSTPTKLGELPVSASGSYSGAALIPAGIEAGSHTIQAIGYTPDGSTLALSVGVTVKSVAAIRGANPVVKASAGAKIAGTRFTVNATGVQARCMVSFWTKGTTVKTKAGAAGRASAILTAPSAKGTWALTAKVTGAGCEQRVAKTMIKVTGEPAGNTHAAKAGAIARK